MHCHGRGSGRKECCNSLWYKEVRTWCVTACDGRYKCQEDGADWPCISLG